MATIFSLSVDNNKVGKAFQKIPVQLLLRNKFRQTSRLKKNIARETSPPLPGYLMVHLLVNESQEND